MTSRDGTTQRISVVNPRVLTLMGHNPTRRHAGSKNDFEPLGFIQRTLTGPLPRGPRRFPGPRREKGSFIGNGTIPLIGPEMLFQRAGKAGKPMVPFALRPILVPRNTASVQMPARPYSPAIPAIQAGRLQTFSASRDSALPGGKFR